MKPGENIQHDDVIIKAVHAHNIERGNSTRKQHKKGEGLGYLITLAGKTIYHAGDTDFIPEMRELGIVDAAMLPIGGTFTMDIGEAVAAAIAINPKVVIPLHRFGSDPQMFADEIQVRSDIRPLPLDVGEACCLDD